VAVSLGIFAFAILALIGLLPSGMAAFKKSKIVSVQANILTQRLNEVNQTPFSSLIDPTVAPLITSLRFYNEEGLGLDALVDSKSADSLRPSDFPATAIYASSISIEKNLNFPATGNAAASDSVLKAVVMITDISSPGSAMKFPALISNLGK
jgi:hypothetical protein